MIVYYSGTGNSRFAAQFLAHQLSDDIINAGVQIHAGIDGNHRSDRPWVFVSPTYSWQIPHIFSDYIRKSAFSGCKDAYFILTCGNDVGHAEAGAVALCREKGFRFRGLLEVVMPENYLAMFSVPEKSEAEKIIAAAIPTLQAGGVQIQGNADFPKRRITPLDRLKSGLVNWSFYRFFVTAHPFYAKECCTGCGHCVQVCPLNNIRLQDGRPVWGRQCTHCMACICGCPTQAIEYGKKSQGKPRYQCPPYMEAP